MNIKGAAAPSALLFPLEEATAAQKELTATKSSVIVFNSPLRKMKLSTPKRRLTRLRDVHIKNVHLKAIRLL